MVSFFRVRIFILFLVSIPTILIASLPQTEGFSRNYPPPLRFIARADVLKISRTEYSIVECLDIYNDDYHRPLIITAITADTWRGHKPHNTNEDWFENRRPIMIEAGKNKRVAEKRRIVTGSIIRNWWVRWIRFNIVTNRGQFSSNYVSSPFNRPGVIVSETGKDRAD